MKTLLLLTILTIILCGCTTSHVVAPPTDSLNPSWNMLWTRAIADQEL